MRTILIALLMTLATQAGADDKVTSGMLACSSNENNFGLKCDVSIPLELPFPITFNLSNVVNFSFNIVFCNSNELGKTCVDSL